MKEFLKGLFAVGTMTFVLVGCTSSPKHHTSGTQPGQRIHIPQEQVTLDRAIQPKVMPTSYRNWLMQGENQARSREYERFLEQNGSGNIIPSFELFKTARAWDQCGKSEYMIPNQEL